MDGGHREEAEIGRSQKKPREKKDGDECNESGDRDMLTGQGKGKFQADPSTWDVNLFLPASKVERDSTCIMPEDSVIRGALTLAPNGEGKFKTPIRFDREPPKNVVRVWAGRVVRERDNIFDDTDEKSEKKSKDVADSEVAAVLVRFLEGCSEFPALQQGTLEAVRRALIAKKTGAPLPPHASDMVFPLLALAFERLTCLKDKGGQTEARMSAVEAKLQSMGGKPPQTQKWSLQEYESGQTKQQVRTANQ
mmetsp:Transcript_40572/g.79950  ORF Transcript_40572/g.79950 Transcript_40572/m.79950 type:complete len:250 (+) Transcript_40572:563-1312(+)